jgi:tRNA nucleotidyltransferase (CCA-adding enzyme)
MMVLDATARAQAPLAVRFAALCHDLGKGQTSPAQWPRHIGHEARSAQILQGLCQRWRVPQECRELAEVVAREHGHIHASLGLSAAGTVRLLDRLDAWRRPERLSSILQACVCDARGRLGRESQDYPQAQRLQQAHASAMALNTAAVARDAAAQGLRGPAIGQRIQQARIQTLRELGWA